MILPSLDPVARRRGHQADVEHLLGWPSGQRGWGYWSTVFVLSLLAAAGAGSLIIMALQPALPAKWGYTAATLAFLVQTCMAAPLLALTARLAKGLWAAPLHRLSELLALGGLVVSPLFIFLLFQLPAWPGRPSIWFDWPGAPALYDSAAVAMLALAGLVLVFVGSAPDRPLTPLSRLSHLPMPGEFSRPMYPVVSPKHWRLLDAATGLLGIIYALLYVYVQLLLTSDMAMSLVPGWHSAIMPPAHAIQGLQAGFAAVLIAAALARHFGKLERFLSVDPFWSASKLLLALALLFFYLFWSEFLTYWYGRTPDEQALLNLLMFGPYVVPFILSLGLNFVVPFALLLWNSVRLSTAGPVAAAASILLGTFFEQVRLFVPAWTVAGPVVKRLTVVPATQFPTLLDLLIVAGGPAAVTLLVLLSLKWASPIAVWEYKAQLLLRADEPYLRTSVPVLAKPA